MTSQQPSEPTEADIAAGASLATLVAAQATIRARYQAQAVALASNSAQQFHGWYDTAAITAWAAALATQIEALQRAQAMSTDAYLSRVLSQMVGRRVRPVGRVAVNSLRQGITHAGAYGRAADVFRWQQSRFDDTAKQLLSNATPAPFDLVVPISAAVARVASVADMDMQMADQAQSHKVLEDNADRHDIRGYRRVIHPELSKGGTCGLCIAASDRIYSVKELKALHDRCECTVLPIVGEKDPGSGLNNLDLKTLYRNAGGSTSREQLKKTAYKVDEHGELGPVLVVQNNKFRNARQAAKDENRVPSSPKTEAEKLAQVARIRESLAKALPKAQDLAANDPKQWGAYLTKLEARINDLDQQLAA